MRLNLGAGLDRSLGLCVNLDVSPATNPDIVADVEQGIPFKSESFDQVWCKDFLEHLVDFTGALEEIYRVCRPKARVIITVPHFSCANTFIDFTHCRAMSYFSFDYLAPDSQYSYYANARFLVRHRYIFFHHSWMSLPIQVMANRFAELYEHHFAWILPAWFLYVELEACK